MLLGIDKGPQQTLASLHLENVAQVHLASSFIRDPEHWGQLVRDRQVDAVVLGTSTSERGFKAEQACLRAACDLHLPAIVVEDMPGNYRAVPDLRPDLLVVESAAVAEYVCQNTDGIQPAAVIAGGSVRYDRLRLHALSGHRLKTNNKSRCVVWLGQPETQTTLVSLELLLPHFSRMALVLLFKAHPRDDGYRSGGYQSLFRFYKHNVVDVSRSDLAELLAFQPALVATHFSSMAIELAFLGIPSCNVLFPESGGGLYTEMTGLKLPFLCEAGGSGTLSDADLIEYELEGLLFDGSLRQTQMARFDEYFNIATLQQHTVVSAIERVVLRKQKHR